MTAADIRRSVNSQLLTVFFLPLAGAARTRRSHSP